MEKNYNLKITKKVAIPRSERLRKAGAGVSGGVTTISYSPMGDQGGVIGDGHTHDNKEHLDQITTDDNGYGYLTQYRETPSDTDPQATEYRLVTEKVKAGFADIAYDLTEDSPVRGQFLSKVNDDEAAGLIRFDKGIKVGEGDKGISNSGSASLLNALVETFLRSPEFREGFTGEGWRLALENGLSSLELDRLTVRQIMTVFELVIAKVRAVGGTLVVSAASGKIKDAALWRNKWLISLEGPQEFAAGDIVRCQTFNGTDVRGYWLKVDSTLGSSDNMYCSVLDPRGGTPQAGDEVVQFGNVSDTTRQGLISISAREGTEPYVDVYDGVDSMSLEGKLRARLGGLDGIATTHFPEGAEPQGYGLYSDNAYLKGNFVLSTGEDVKTLIEANADGIAAISQRFDEDGKLVNTAGLVTTTNFPNWFAQQWYNYNQRNAIVSIESFASVFAQCEDSIASVSTFVRRDANGMLQSGVHIKGDQIILDGLTLSNEIIAGDADGKRIHIDPDGKQVVLYDENSFPRTIIESNEYADPGEVFGSQSSGAVGFVSGHVVPTGNIMAFEPEKGSVMALSGDGSSRKVTSDLVLTDAFHTDTQCTISLSGAVHVECRSHAPAIPQLPENPTITDMESQMGTQTYSAATVDIRVICETFEDSDMDVPVSTLVLARHTYTRSASMERPEGNTAEKTVSGTSNKTFEGAAATVPAGWHRLRLVVFQQVDGDDGNRCSATWGSQTAGNSDFSANFVADSYQSRFFGNGFCVGLNTDNFVSVIRNGSGLSFEAVTNKYGLRVTPSGVQIKRGLGASWTSL